VESIHVDAYSSRLNILAPICCLSKSSCQDTVLTRWPKHLQSRLTKSSKEHCVSHLFVIIFYLYTYSRDMNIYFDITLKMSLKALIKLPKRVRPLQTGLSQVINFSKLLSRRNLILIYTHMRCKKADM
jgi:hypothetical protein